MDRNKIHKTICITRSLPYELLPHFLNIIKLYIQFFGNVTSSNFDIKHATFKFNQTLQHVNLFANSFNININVLVILIP